MQSGRRDEGGHFLSSFVPFFRLLLLLLLLLLSSSSSCLFRVGSGVCVCASAANHDGGKVATSGAVLSLISEAPVSGSAPVRGRRTRVSTSARRVLWPPKRVATALHRVVLGFTGFYWVLLGCIGVCSSIIHRSHWIEWLLKGWGRFHRVLPSCSWFYLVLLSFTGLYWVLLGCIGVCSSSTHPRIWIERLLKVWDRFSSGFTEFYLVLLGFTGFYWALSAFFIGYLP